MKKTITIVIAFIVLISCNTNDDNDPVELVGKWLLIEQYADPGDGSGDFMPVNSDKTIEFYLNGTFLSNGSLCTMNADSNEETTGTYDDSINSIAPDDCVFYNFGLVYELDKRHLIINYPCIEGCRQKFSKVD